jgi:glycosyltransferase involved in cell wall biosynthesis
MRAVPSDPRPVVAVFRSPLFNASETFVRNHIAGLRRYRAVAVGLEAKGEAEVPRLLPANAAERLALKLLGRVGPLAERLRAEDPALVHAHFGTDGLLALPLAERLGVPLVTTLHGYDVGRSRTRLLLSGRLSWIRYALLRRRVFEGGDLFLAVSEAVRRRALALGFPADRTIVHHLGVDLEYFRPGEAPPEPGLILHVGRLVEKKGTSDLLDAFATVSGARLVVIGDGPLRPPLERRAKALDVRFLGALPPSEVLGWMQRAWLLAAPSVTARDGDCEGLPTILCEAAACGLPAVATRHSGIPEAVVDGETGLLVPERDPAALASALSALLGDAPSRERMSRAARALAELRFDSVCQYALLEQRYDALVRGERCA